MRVLLDTAAFVFAVEAPDRLSRRAYATLKNPDNIREMSVVSLTEIAVKTTLGKLSLPATVVREAIVDMDIRIVPFTPDYAFQLFELPIHHRDPFDRQIIAHALSEDIPVVTSDRRFALYTALKVIW